MKTLPSKELLNEVLKIELACKKDIPNEIIRFDPEANEIAYFIKSMRWGDVAKRINIYELTYKCKEWALEQGYTFTVSTGNTNTLVEVLRNDAWTEEHPETVFISMEQEEPEAIFKACEWIKENK